MGVLRFFMFLSGAGEKIVHEFRNFSPSSDLDIFFSVFTTPCGNVELSRGSRRMWWLECWFFNSLECVVWVFLKESTIKKIYIDHFACTCSLVNF